MMHAEQSYLNTDYSVLEQKGILTYHCIIFQADLLLFGSIYTCLPVSICSHTQELTPYKLLNMSPISLNFSHLPFLSWSHSSAH